MARNHKAGEARLGYRPSKKSVKRMVEKIHALTDRTGTWQETTKLVGNAGLQSAKGIEATGFGPFFFGC
jgi:hypothetical protein